MYGIYEPVLDYSLCIIFKVYSACIKLKLKMLIVTKNVLLQKMKTKITTSHLRSVQVKLCQLKISCIRAMRRQVLQVVSQILEYFLVILTIFKMLVHPHHRSMIQLGLVKKKQWKVMATRSAKSSKIPLTTVKSLNQEKWRLLIRI